MKSYIDWYSGQLVTSADMDSGTIDGVEDTEQAMNIDDGMAQTVSTASPDSTVYGGIVRDLEVSAVATDDFVSITPGAARDELGRTAEIPSSVSPAATLLITRTGATPIGDSSMATNVSGADISLSCPSGDNIVASIFLVYAQALTNQVQNEAGTWVYKNVAESFRFDIQIGASFDPAAVPAVAPFASLANGKILLADVLLQNVGGSMQVLSVHTTSESWDLLGGNYVGWSGRRSDWLSAEVDDIVLPLQDNIGNIRGETPREFLYTLLQKLQSTGAGSGASAIGSQILSYALHNARAADISLPAGSISSQVAILLYHAAASMYRGGNNVLAPEAGYNGIIADPTSMQADEVLFGIKTLQTAGSANFLRIGKLRGHLCIPDVFYENWRRGYTVTIPGVGPFSGRSVATFTDTWVKSVTGSADCVIRSSVDGAPMTGAIMELRAPTATDAIYLFHGVDVGATTAHAGWLANAAPWVNAQFRIRLLSISNGMVFRVGLIDPVTGSHFGVHVDIQIDAKWRLEVRDSAGLLTTDAVSFGDATAATWYTVRMSVVADGVVQFQLNNGAEVTVSAAPGGFSANPYVPYFWLESAAGIGSSEALMCEDVVVSASQLPADKL